MIETNFKLHDIVALAPIIEGAGGMVTTWDGDNAAKGGRIIAAGDRAVYDEARRLPLQGRLSSKLLFVIASKAKQSTGA